MGKPHRNRKKPNRSGRKVKVGRIGDVPEGRGATVKLKDGTEVALFNVGGKFHAIENFCPHKGYPLADSRVYGNIVECNLHSYRFDIETGRCLTKSKCSIERFDVEVADDWIQIVL